MEMIGKIACLVVLCMVLIAAAPHAEALTCPEVDSYMTNCKDYLTNTGSLGTCCDGVKQLNLIASTTIDRHTACTCLQEAAKITVGIDMTKVLALPTTCGIVLPFIISLNMDCSTVF